MLLFEIDDSEFTDTLEAIDRDMIDEHGEILRETIGEALKGIVADTPIEKGVARAGFLPAWRGLGLPGLPATPLGLGETTHRGRRYVAAGNYRENLRELRGPELEFTNDSRTISRRGRPFYYAEQALQRAVAMHSDPTVKYEKRYRKVFAKNGAA